MAAKSEKCFSFHNSASLPQGFFQNQSKPERRRCLNGRDPLLKSPSLDQFMWKIKQDNLQICSKSSRISASTLNIKSKKTDKKTKSTNNPKKDAHLSFKRASTYKYVILCLKKNSYNPNNSNTRNTRNNDCHLLNSADKERERHRSHNCPIFQGHTSD